MQLKIQSLQKIRATPDYLREPQIQNELTCALHAQKQHLTEYEGGRVSSTQKFCKKV